MGGEQGRCRQVIGSSPFVRKIEAAKGFQSGISDLVFADPWRSRLNFSALLTRFLFGCAPWTMYSASRYVPLLRHSQGCQTQQKSARKQPTEPMSSDVECYWEKCYQEPCVFVFALGMLNEFWNRPNRLIAGSNLTTSC